MYDEVANAAFSIDRYSMPAKGITYPEYENPVNLFHRQLKLEEVSFKLAYDKYQKSLQDMIKIGRAD
jgi:hypothetical protein